MCVRERVWAGDKGASGRESHQAHALTCALAMPPYILRWASVFMPSAPVGIPPAEAAKERTCTCYCSVKGSRTKDRIIAR